MKQFLVTYHAPAEAMEGMNDMTPEQQAEGMKPWMDWAERCGEGLVTIGAPIGKSERITNTGTVGSNLELCGYSILQAENVEAAKAMLENHPHLQWKDVCSIEIHEILPLPGQG